MITRLNAMLVLCFLLMPTQYSQAATPTDCILADGYVFHDCIGSTWQSPSVWEMPEGKDAYSNANGESPTSLVNWKVIPAQEVERGLLIDVRYGTQKGNATFGVGAKAEWPKNYIDLKEYRSGRFEFDLKVLDWGRSHDMSLQISCTYPCGTGEMPIKIINVNAWEKQSFLVQDLVEKGLDLSKLDSTFGLQPTWNQQQGAHFQVDNIRWIKGIFNESEPYKLYEPVKDAYNIVKDFFGVGFYWLASALVNLGIILVFSLFLWSFRLVTINIKMVFIFSGLYLIYSVALVYGAEFINPLLGFSTLHWSWGGKILAIGEWLIVILAMGKVIPKFKAADAGFTLKQNKGSIVPSFIVICFVLGLVFFRGSFSTENLQAETLMFQATMPGFDEEPMFRGVLLYILCLGVMSGSTSLAGAKISWAGIIIALLFGLIHGVKVEELGVSIQGGTILITGFIGFVLLWLRQRTGSLVLPVLFHNLWNFSLQFFNG